MSESVLVIVETIAVTDLDKFADYQRQARQQLLDRGGVLLARGGEALEGPALDRPMVVQRWPSAQAFRDWQNSEDYRPLLALRRQVAELRLIIIPEF